MPTIASQLEHEEKQITQCEKSLESVQRAVRLGGLTSKQRIEFKEKEANLKREIETHEKKMKELRKENWKSAVVSVILLGIVFLVYQYFSSS